VLAVRPALESEYMAALMSGVLPAVGVFAGYLKPPAARSRGLPSARWRVWHADCERPDVVTVIAYCRP
jgi:hypothetical protein